MFQRSGSTHDSLCNNAWSAFRPEWIGRFYLQLSHYYANSWSDFEVDQPCGSNQESCDRFEASEKLAAS